MTKDWHVALFLSREKVTFFQANLLPDVSVSGETLEQAKKNQN
jgi:hypothetical protein